MNKALFLDRDGVINIDHGYVYQPEEFQFIEGIFELCALALQLNYQIIVITNQAGIARGYYTPEQFLTLTQWMKNEFSKRGVTITDVYYCPHHPEKGIGEYKQNCNCRKPQPGMITKAVNDHALDITNSVFIGDKISDIKAANAAGIETKILISSHYQDDETIKAHRINNITEAARFLS